MIWTQAIKKLLLAVQTSSSEGLRLDSAVWVELANVSREGEGQMKEDNSFRSGWY